MNFYELETSPSFGKDLPRSGMLSVKSNIDSSSAIHFQRCGNRTAHTIQGMMELWVYRGSRIFCVVCNSCPNNVKLLIFFLQQLPRTELMFTCGYLGIASSCNGQLKVHNILCGEEYFSPACIILYFFLYLFTLTSTYHFKI